MPSPSEIREARIRRLVVLARRLHESGVSYSLYDRVERITWQLWPTLEGKTRRDYIQLALKAVLERPRGEFGIPEAEEPPQEEART